MWLAENTVAKTIKGIYAKTIPLNKKIHDGIIDSDNALKRSFLFQQMNQNTRYAKHNAPFTDKYTINALSNQKLKYVCGILNIINAKHPYLPICSAITTALTL